MRGYVIVRKHPVYPQRFFLGDGEWFYPARAEKGKLVQLGAIAIPFSELKGYIVPMGVVNEEEIYRHLNPHKLQFLTTEEMDMYAEMTEEQLNYEKKYQKVRINYDKPKSK